MAWNYSTCSWMGRLEDCNAVTSVNIQGLLLIVYKRFDELLICFWWFFKELILFDIYLIHFLIYLETFNELEKKFTQYLDWLQPFLTGWNFLWIIKSQVGFLPAVKQTFNLLEGYTTQTYLFTWEANVYLYRVSMDTRDYRDNLWFSFHPFISVMIFCFHYLNNVNGTRKY